MKILTQQFIQLPSLGGKTVRVNGDLASVYDLMLAAGANRANYRLLNNLCSRFPQVEALLIKTTFTGASEEAIAVRLKDWAQLGDYLQQICPSISTDSLKKLNQDLNIFTIDVTPVPAIAPSAAPDVSVTDYGKLYANGTTSRSEPLIGDATVINYGTKAEPLVADGKLVFSELDGAEIRSDGDRFSVHDFIQIVGGQKNPWEVWKRLCDKYSELLTVCEEYKFPGTRGGAARKTPATNREGIIQIAQLLPGEFGAKFRAEAAKIITQGIILRKQLTSVLAEHGVNKDGYRLVTNAIYIGLLGKPASALRKEMGLANGENIRPHLNPAQWMSLGTVEIGISTQLKKQQAWGNEQCAAIAHETALKIGQLIGLAA